MAGSESGPTRPLSPEPEWRVRNRANWDERVGIHLGPGSNYDLAPLRDGRAVLDPIVTGVLGSVRGLRVVHLQCHFGLDTLAMAQQGADVVGVDFSAPAVDAARSLAGELSLPARFVQSDLYELETALPSELGSFDRVLVSWGALCWLPDMDRWGQIVRSLLKPGGWLALAEAHPAAYVFDDSTAKADGMPGWYAPYLGREALVIDNAEDYADPAARLRNTRTYEWLHPLSDVIGALLRAGLQLEQFEEHGAVPWRLFGPLTEGRPGWWQWPDKEWLPLSYSLRARKPLSTA